ncbi:MAG: response regulator [Deltaproteobacteria bacterium]|nr:response regulator [Deltaproteobacteria bacterium]
MSTERRKSRRGRRGGGPAGADLERARGLHVLVVDDFDDNREMYAEYLAHVGMRVSQARDGHDAVRKAIDLSPDLIVMDLSLPDLDGWDATRLLRADPRTARTPIVAVTGHAIGTHAATARAVGCDEVLTKPLLPEDLLDHIVSIVARRR